MSKMFRPFPTPCSYSPGLPRSALCPPSPRFCTHGCLAWHPPAPNPASAWPTLPIIQNPAQVPFILSAWKEAISLSVGPEQPVRHLWEHLVDGDLCSAPCQTAGSLWTPPQTALL